MKKKRIQYYYLLGTVVMLFLSCLCSFTFVKDNLEQAARKNEFESIYLNSNIDFIVPAPSESQIDELESSAGNGINVITPYFETNTGLYIDGKTANGTSLLFPFVDKMQYTPYGSSRIIDGAKQSNEGEAIADQRYVDKNGCSIGDDVFLNNIEGQDYSFKITSIAETNTYYENGTIALILSERMANQLKEAGIRYSAAYILSDNKDVCKTFLYSEYKPLSRLKDRSEFDNEETYNQHLQNFNDADWSKEITNCQENYKTLSVKYENIPSGIWANIGIMTAIVAVVIIVFNIILLTNSNIKSFMKVFLIKKSGTKSNIKEFYKSGITVNLIVFCAASIAFYVFLAQKVRVSLFGSQLKNCLVPMLTAIIVSMLIIVFSGRYVDKHYKIKVVKKKDSTEEVQVEVI